MRKKLYTATWVLLLVVGIFLVSLPFLENSAIQHLISSEMNGKIVQQDKNKKANFDFSKIESVSASSISKAIFSHKHTMIGKISIPSVSINLPVYYGLDNEELLSGVGTMKPNQQLGKGNYAIAGHHMNNEKILFGPLHKVVEGDAIYITNGKKVYKYEVSSVSVIDQYDTQYITKKYKKPTLTLITCASGTPNEPNRTMVRAKLSSITDLSDKTAKYFK